MLRKARSPTFVAHRKRFKKQTIKKTKTTPINLYNMDFYLSLYPKTLEASELRDVFKYGFKIKYFGTCTRFPSTCSNLTLFQPNSTQTPEEERQKIYIKIELGSVAGPFDKYLCIIRL